MAGTARPLDGVSLLDPGQIYREPCAGSLPALAGATVVEVEPPDGEYLLRRAHGHAELQQGVLRAGPEAPARTGRVPALGGPGGRADRELRAGGLVDFLGGAHLHGAIVTALFDRERTGRGRAVEVAMQDAALPALASDLGRFFGGGRDRTPPRTGDRHGGLSMAPCNVHRAADGRVAAISVTEEHGRGLMRAMGRDGLLDDPRSATNAAWVSRMAEVEGMVEGWMRGSTRAGAAAAAARRSAVPAAPVRDLEEVVNDHHPHERGMLRWADHPEVGRVTLPSSPLRLEGATAPEIVPSPPRDGDGAGVLGGMLGLGEAGRAAPRASGAVGSGPEAA